MRRDPLTGLGELAGVAPALEHARAAVDDAYRHPALRLRGGEVEPVRGFAVVDIP